MNQKLAKKIINSNAFLAEGLYHIFANKYNNMLSRFIDEISCVNSIENVDLFFEMMKNLPKQWHKTFTNFKNSYSENTLYGYASEVMKFAGIDKKDLFFLPLLEHGISYNGILELSRYNVHRPYFFQGRSCENQWNRISKKDAYYIGPFIHYASSYYNTIELQEIKKKIGRTALVFLPHSVEFDDFTIHVDDIINKYISHNKLNVDTVLVCVYYNDLSNELIKSIASRDNFKLVCAGFKVDPMFVCRLKSILEMSDVCFFNSFSTSIGYAFYLDKLIVPDINKEEKNRFQKLYGYQGLVQLENFEKCFLNNDDKAKYNFIDRLWGISEIKSPSQIRSFFNKSKKQMILNAGF